LLEPSRFKIITHIKYKIDSLSYLLGITNYDKEDDDPLLPLVDIIRGSLMKYDYETSTKALKTLEDKIVNLIEEDDFDTLKYCRYAPKDVDYSKISVGAANFKEYQHYLIKKIYKNIFNHFERMGQLAIKHLDYHSSREIITIISHLINKILEKESVNDQAKATINEGLLSLQTIGITASENNMNDIVTDVSKEILEIGHLCISQQLGSNAHKSCEILIKLNPNSVHTWLFAGDTAFLLEMYTNAINAFKKANEIEETPQAYSKLKNIYKKLGFKNEEEVALSEELSLLKKEAYKTDISSIIDDLGTS